MAARNAETEIRELRSRIAALVEEAAVNEKLLRKNQERELEILRAGNLAQLFEVICRRLRVSYGLEAVRLIIEDARHETRHLLLADKVDLAAYPEVLFTDALGDMSPQFPALHKPWLGPYVGPDHHRLVPGVPDVRSLALIPLRRDEQLTGCVVFGSRDDRRFTRHLGTDFLAHLGVMISFALENAVNRSRLVRSGVTDYLTGWHNRRYLEERLLEELAKARRSGTPVGCLLIDLDHFKRINDELGHLAGDLALRETSMRINAEVRTSDAAARYGGDEFVLLLPNATLDQGYTLAERIRKAVCAAPVELQPGATRSLTVSIGVASITLGREEPDLKAAAEQLVAAADAALYKAKENGRNCVGVIA